VLAQFRDGARFGLTGALRSKGLAPGDQLADLKHREDFQTQQNHSGNDCEIEEGFHPGPNELSAFRRAVFNTR